MKTIQYKDMGARIRAQRERLGYTREQLAEKLDVSTKFCSDIGKAFGFALPADRLYSLR